MATTSFRLDNAKNKDGSLKTDKATVRVCVYVSKFKRPEVSTTLSIEPKHWHFEKERAKATLTNHTKFNIRLNGIVTDLTELWEANLNADRDELKRLMQEYFRGRDWNKPNSEKKNDAPFVAYITNFIKDCKGDNKERLVKHIREPGTIRGYNQTLDQHAKIMLNHFNSTPLTLMRKAN